MLIRLLGFLALATAVVATEATPQAPMIAAGQAGSAQQLPANPATGEQVVLVIHTAEDCPVCKAWREDPSGLAVAKQLPKRWPLLQVVFIERKSLNGSESESLYPARLRYMYEARRDRYQLSPPVPLFEIVRGKQLLARQAGLQAWSQEVLPTLRELEEGRGSPAAASSPTSVR